MIKAQAIRRQWIYAKQNFTICRLLPVNSPYIYLKSEQNKNVSNLCGTRNKMGKKWRSREKSGCCGPGSNAVDRSTEKTVEQEKKDKKNNEKMDKIQ